MATNYLFTVLGLNHMKGLLSTTRFSVKVESGGIQEENRNKKGGLQAVQEQSSPLLQYMSSTWGVITYHLKSY